MNTIQSTIYGAELLIHLLLGHIPTIDEKSTMNERLGIAGTARPGAGEPVRLGILTVGNKGHRSVPGSDGIALTSVIDHTTNHASTYNPIPFVLRPVEEDLSLAMRAKYALRKEVVINGVNYYAYYGLRLAIDPEDVNVTKTKVTKEDGQVLEEPFVPNTSDLFPEPIELPVSGAVSTTDISYVASCVIRVRLDSTAIEEFVNAAKILYNGDERYAIMSEFALCTGADRQFTVNSTVGQINFLESIGTQIYAFSADHKALYYNSQELTMDFDIGNQVPMLGTASIPTLETIG